MERESFVFYRSFFEALEGLPVESYARLCTAIVTYGLNGEVASLEGIERNLFALIRPQIDANNKRYKDGKKGGRPSSDTKPLVTKTETTGYAERKPLVIKVEENEKPNANVNVNVNDNENVNGGGFDSFVKEVTEDWNSTERPPYRFSTSLTLPYQHRMAFLRAQSFGIETVRAARENYARIRASPDKTDDCPRYQSLIGFLENGIDKFQADPDALFLKKTVAVEVARAVEERAKIPKAPTICPACGEKMRVTLTASQCMECGAYYEPIDGEWRRTE